MKKKIFCLTAMLVFVGVVLLGCGKSTYDYVCENMAEWTQTFYYAEGEDFYCSISSGTRENPYLLNGSCENCVDFALVSVIFENKPSTNVIDMQFEIDGQSFEKELEINTLNQAYMVDLEQKLTGNEAISLSYNGKTTNLENISKNFAIDDKKALQIACNELQTQIEKNKTFGNLNAECYLRVLDKKANNFDSVFWCFSVLNEDNENFSVIISTEDGSILAKG